MITPFSVIIIIIIVIIIIIIIIIYSFTHVKPLTHLCDIPQIAGHCTTSIES